MLFQCFAEWLPCNEIKRVVVPGGITSGGGLGALDEVLFHIGSVGSGADVIRNSASYVLIIMEEGCAGAR